MDAINTQLDRVDERLGKVYEKLENVQNLLLDPLLPPEQKQQLSTKEKQILDREQLLIEEKRMYLKLAVEEGRAPPPPQEASAQPAAPGSDVLATFWSL
eukprot:CAMPEP_0202900608 /NCGR_PEP_ID=MMETSP1392-20130828/11933_1 /ASSEMBLY_ACC=CAM_ASM_000868 /TAXON_ID=225041 /ORGANISM="Chlamydomonas chlamydogama, Strain SAG 11-48b" /LENGTH=98 /DNA_ID=CAMNT_0049587029 /DNA_START=78 /DNA_END=371 /DNA_ORIENTATION=+